ncbi:hypothetical protein WR25_16131 [Diploscapter pachys]|uniref:Uncharacterized protein n=1 Tax=Diploscapter pachys TaxID=2018661 RepID=A0A2A2LB41_9BILA|nr:hypothetical protein WR25_16131 [Diploscapter pachys]
MGGNESRHLRCGSGSGGQGCLSLHNHIDKEEEYGRPARPTKLSKSAIKKLRKQQKERPEFVWDEIPTPSVHEHRDTMSEPTIPTQERLLQVR